MEMADGTASRADDSSNAEQKDDRVVDINYRFKAGAYLTSVAVLSGLAAFGVTFAAVRKKDPKIFARGMELSPGMEVSGPELGLRALKWGTFYAFTGTSLITLAVWKLSGAKTLAEFSEKVRGIMPKLLRKEKQERGKEISDMDLLNYVSIEHQKDVNGVKKS